MKRSYEAPSRTPRLIKVWHLLAQNPHPGGLTAQQIADLCSVSKRTAYRDLNALQNELGVPIGEDGARRYIVPGYQLPPIRFTVPEAMTIFLAARLMLNYRQKYDPNIASTFLKLNSAIDPPLQDEIRKTMEWLEKRPLDAAVVRNLAALAEAWAKQQTVRMRYHTLGDEEATERLVDPYFIEQAGAGHASYLIGHCHLADETRVFKIERIKALEITSQTYQVPDDFDANEFLSPAMGIVVTENVATVRFRFVPELARLAEETIWHPSQSVAPQSDGSAIVTLRVSNTIELLSFVMRWGEKAEVLEPESLRQDVIKSARAMLELYG